MSCRHCQVASVGIELRRACGRRRVTIPALSVAEWVHSSTMATVPEDPLRSRTVGLPESGSDPGLSPWDLSTGGVVQALTRIRPARSWFAPRLAPAYRKRATRPCVRTCPAAEAARCPEPLCPDPALPDPGRRPAPPREVLPPFLAHTSSCARPRPSRRPRSSLRLRVFAGCSQPLLGRGPSQRYSAFPSRRAWTPTPAASGVLLPASSPRASAFPAMQNGSAPRNRPASDFSPAQHFGAAVIPLMGYPSECGPPYRLWFRQGRSGGGRSSEEGATRCVLGGRGFLRLGAEFTTSDL